jgi:hypothetical protein
MKQMLPLALGAAGLIFQFDVASADVTKAYAGRINSVAVARGSGTMVTDSSTFSNLPGASVRVRVPAGATGLLVARFTAESGCFSAGADNEAWCSIQILARKVRTATDIELEPATDNDFAFDSVNETEEGFGWESHATERSAVVAPGKYVVRVQWAVANQPGPATFRVDEWHLTVEESTTTSAP